MSRRNYPTRYARGPFRVVALSLKRGYAIVRDGPRPRYALTYYHPHTGATCPRTMTLPAALSALAELAADEA